MTWLLNAAYLLLAVLTAPWWLRKKREDWRGRFGHLDPIPHTGKPRLLIHAVSVGEVNLIRTLVDQLLDAGIEPVIAATTDTGIARARSLYAERCPVVRYPLDASWMIRRFLDATQPDAAALVELELWPNFIRGCRQRDIPVAVINGRLSARSFKNYRRGRFVIGRSCRALAFAAVQDETYASRFREMGVDASRCHVVGTMKWDAAQTDAVAGAEALGRAMGIDPNVPLIVAGSTAPGEHELLRDAVPDDVQLLCAPRRPEWFDPAASVFPGCVRRSETSDAPREPGARRFILDTIGELRAAYALADLVVIGRSFGDLYGSDPMEAAALGKPVIIGPAVTDFVATVETMRARDAIVQVEPEELQETIARLLDDSDARDALATRARQCVVDEQGASARHLELLQTLMPAGRSS